jgi:NADPH:quinone reductase-like Zn-dependent oxidoreductase
LRANGARCPGLRIFEMHLYDRDREGRRRLMQRVIDALAAGDVSPVVFARLPLEAAADAHRMIEEGRSLGKVLLVPALGA